MFQIEPGTFKRTVDINVPTEDGSEVQTVEITYNVMPVSRAKALDTGQDVEDFVHDSVAKIEGLVDEKKKPLPWSPEVEAKFWDLPFTFNPVRDKYAESINEARAKN